MEGKTLEILGTSLNAAATYAVPPLTLLRYGRILLGIDRADPETGFRPERRDPAYVAFIMQSLMPLINSYFRVEVEGVEHVPHRGGALVVGNHNSGLQPVDSFIAGHAIMEHQGVTRPLFGLGHDYMFREPALAALLEKIGIIRANPRAADAAFEQDGVVVVYPGGDIDTFKPYTQRNTIQFGNRKGFIRLALRNRVPIVPAVSVGCHETWVVLTRGEQLAKLLGLKKRLRTEVFPIVLSLPWGITSGFLPFIPLPAKISLRFLEPISWDHISADQADDPLVLEACYREVTDVMQAALTQMASQRSFPVIG
ncbi:acyltransferase family protein [Myxococcota bacterium]|nr:acyltransferase family protein [Myxococcota bacterium]MBU1536984.1 acyltransferase family protein [Myxococcota bacterium]